MHIKVKGEKLKVKGFIVFALCSLLLVQANAQELLNYPLDTINGEEVYKYEVERSIGLYRIGVNFNVSQNEIVRLNPQLRERGLHFGEILYLPTGRAVKENPKESEAIQENRNLSDSIRENPNVSEAIAEDQNLSDTIRENPNVSDTIEQETRRIVELALMLPFESQQAKRSGNAERMMEFYQGALLALHDMQNANTLYRLRVYDTERSERKVNALCDSTELDSVRGVLGLVYPIQIERMAIWCDVHQVPLLLPFSDNMDLKNHPQVLQFNSTDQQEADSLCQWMLAQDTVAHFVAVEVRESDMSLPIRTLRQRMSEHGITYTGMGMHDVMVDSCAYALKKDKENIIVLHSDRLQHVRMLLPHLTKLKEEGYRIRIVSQYSWQKEELGLPQVYTSMFKSESGSEEYETLWSRAYAGRHVNEAPRYDLLGYDLMRALAGWIEAGNNPIERSEIVNGLQSDIQWVQVKNGGWQNGKVEVRVKR